MNVVMSRSLWSLLESVCDATDQVEVVQVLLRHLMAAKTAPETRRTPPMTIRAIDQPGMIVCSLSVLFPTAKPILFLS